MKMAKLILVAAIEKWLFNNFLIIKLTIIIVFSASLQGTVWRESCGAMPQVHGGAKDHMRVVPEV